MEKDWRGIRRWFNHAQPVASVPRPVALRIRDLITVQITVQITARAVGIGDRNDRASGESFQDQYPADLLQLVQIVQTDPRKPTSAI